MNSGKKPSLAALGMLGGAIDRSKVDTIGTPEYAELINKKFGKNGAACMRVVIDSSLTVLESADVSGVKRTVYGEGDVVMLTVLNHGVNLAMPVLVNMSVNRDMAESSVIVLEVFPLVAGMTVPFSGCLWFANIKHSVGSGSNGMVDVHSKSIMSIPNVRARVEMGLMSSWAHFIDGFTSVFVSALDTGIDPAFFRVMFLMNMISVSPLGLELEDGNFYDMGVAFTESRMVTDQYEVIALRHAFRNGVGAFNQKHMEDMTADEVSPAAFAKACMRKVEAMAEKGLFTSISTQKGWFYMPTPDFFLSMV